MKAYKISKRVGDPSSKYAYNPNQLDIDIQKHKEKWDPTKKTIIEALSSYRMYPNDIRTMFVEILKELELIK